LPAAAAPPPPLPAVNACVTAGHGISKVLRKAKRAICLSKTTDPPTKEAKPCRRSAAASSVAASASAADSRAGVKAKCKPGVDQGAK
jgi:hypothetical protein